MALIGNIRVTPEQLIEKGDELKSIVNSLTSQFGEVQNIVNATGSYWIGNAGDTLRRQYSEMNEEVLEILRRLAEYPTDLQKMAGVYIVHNSAAIQKAEALPSDVLE